MGKSISSQGPEQEAEEVSIESVFLLYAAAWSCTVVRPPPPSRGMRKPPWQQEGRQEAAGGASGEDSLS